MSFLSWIRTRTTEWQNENQRLKGNKLEKINCNPERTLRSILGGNYGCAIPCSPFHERSCLQKDVIRSGPSAAASAPGLVPGWRVAHQADLPPRRADVTLTWGRLSASVCYMSKETLHRAAPTSGPRPCGLTFSAQQLIFH